MLKYHIQTIEASSGSAAEFNFNNIPQDYDDLMLVVSARSSRADTSDPVYLKFNNTQFSSNKMLYYRGGDNTYSFGVTVGFLINANGDTSGTFGSVELLVSDYTNSTRAKPISFIGVTENNASRAYENIGTGLTPVTQAITSISIDPNNGDFMQYSSASLYGIKHGSSGEVEVASGGEISYSGGYTIHTFESSGTFVANRDLQVEALVVAGGGGGGSSSSSSGSPGAGGGGGGFRFLSEQALAASASYNVIVGAGGAGDGSNGGGPGGTNGEASVFASYSATGGGGGGSRLGVENGKNGGSGGGGAGSGTKGFGNAGSYTPSEGNDGRDGQGIAGFLNGGGGGGAGGIPSAIDGGNGAASSISGTSLTYAGGGGSGYATGGAGTGYGLGGTGGGGNGGSSTGASGSNGTVNFGGGGGGAGGNDVHGNGGNGGSGIVIIRYLTP